MINNKTHIALLFTLLSLNSVLAQEVKDIPTDFPKTLVLKGEALKQNYQLISVNDFEKTKALKTLLG
jgi:hypothetical protein